MLKAATAALVAGSLLMLGAMQTSPLKHDAATAASQRGEQGTLKHLAAPTDPESWRATDGEIPSDEVVGLWTGVYRTKHGEVELITVQIGLSPLGHYFDSHTPPDQMRSRYWFTGIQVKGPKIRMITEKPGIVFEGTRTGPLTYHGTLTHPDGNVEVDLIRLGGAETSSD